LLKIKNWGIVEAHSLNKKIAMAKKCLVLVNRNSPTSMLWTEQFIQEKMPDIHKDGVINCVDHNDFIEKFINTPLVEGVVIDVPFLLDLKTPQLKVKEIKHLAGKIDYTRRKFISHTPGGTRPSHEREQLQIMLSSLRDVIEPN
jgi:hypothetical protein